MSAMDQTLLEKISNLALLGYYDEDLKMLCVHFFGDCGKHDLMAYLRPDLTWDLREVLSEHVQLFDDHETVEITHSKVGVYESGSGFDQFIRQALEALGENEGLQDDKVKVVLEQGYA